MIKPGTGKHQPLCLTFLFMTNMKTLNTLTSFSPAQHSLPSGGPGCFFGVPVVVLWLFALPPFGRVGVFFRSPRCGSLAFCTPSLREGRGVFLESPLWFFGFLHTLPSGGPGWVFRSPRCGSLAFCTPSLLEGWGGFLGIPVVVLWLFALPPFWRVGVGFRCSFSFLRT